MSNLVSKYISLNCWSKTNTLNWHTLYIHKNDALELCFTALGFSFGNGSPTQIPQGYFTDTVKGLVLIKQSKGKWGNKSDVSIQEIIINEKNNYLHIVSSIRIPTTTKRGAPKASVVNSSPPGQNGHHFRRWHFQMHFGERKFLYFD